MITVNKANLLGIVIFPVLMVFLFANALIFDIPTYEELLEPSALPVTEQLLDYYHGEGEMPDVFSDDEKAHLEDVKEVFVFVKYFSIFLLIVFLCLLRFSDARVFTKGFLLLVVIILLLYILPFDLVFDKFHSLLFEEGTWTFSAESTLIQMYSFDFFQAFFVRILWFTVLFSGILALFGFYSTKKLK